MYHLSVSYQQETDILLHPLIDDVKTHQWHHTIIIRDLKAVSLVRFGSLGPRMKMRVPYSIHCVCPSVCPSANFCGRSCAQGIEVTFTKLSVWTTHEV